MATRIGGVVVLVLGLAMTAEAQVVVRQNWGPGWWGMGPGYTGTTPQESWARGMSEVIRARGDAYEAATRGAINYEQARAGYLENQARWQELHLQRKDTINQQRQMRADANRANRERQQASQPAARPPELLSDVLYDRAAGIIHWPEALMNEGFADLRSQLDDSLKIRARTGDHAPVNRQILDLAQQMTNRLRAQIRDIPAASFMEARRFLDQLANEMRIGLG
jgi:hypothetical protein